MYKYIIIVMKLPKFCPNCGKEINETAQFCEHCGNHLFIGIMVFLELKIN